MSRGFTFMPEIDMNNLSVTVTMPEGTTRDEAVALADQVMETYKKEKSTRMETLKNKLYGG